MSNNVKYLTDANGHKTSVLIPISEWNAMQADLQTNSSLQNRIAAALNILGGNSDALVTAGLPKRGRGRPPKVSSAHKVRLKPGPKPKAKAAPSSGTDLLTVDTIPTSVRTAVTAGQNPLRALRLWRELSHSQVATTIGYKNISSVRGLERQKSKPRAATIGKLAQAFGVLPGVLGVFLNEHYTTQRATSKVS